ncbi:hypothetical protein HWV62_37191 [Athelia sp. TMB]|nr:hypothetical protein HWV62_37191 [Athelia sp. TMB]
MKLSTGSILASMLLATSVSAATIAASKPAGAAYFITNEPSGNHVVSIDIGSDGKLTSLNAVSTGGNGLHGLGAPGAAPGSDGLFSQGSVQASHKAKVLAAVNPGSNTVSLFSINPSLPAGLKIIGRPVSSGGEFPISVAFNEAGSLLCALNGGKVAGVACYSVHHTLGLLPIPNTQRALHLNQTTPAAGPAGTASQISFSQDGKHLIAAVKGAPPTPGYLAVWAFGAGHSLSADFTQVAPASGGLLPFSLTPVPGKNAFFTADPGLGFEIFDFAGGFKNSSSSSAVAVTGQKAICWSAYSKQSGDFYLVDAGASEVLEVSINDDLKGTVVQYVLAAGATSVDVLAVNGPQKAQTIQRFDFSDANVTINKINVQGMATYVY